MKEIKEIILKKTRTKTQEEIKNKTKLSINYYINSNITFGLGGDGSEVSLLGGDCPKMGNLVFGSGEWFKARVLDAAIGVLVKQARGMKNAKSFRSSIAPSRS